MIKNLPANAEDVGSIPGLGRSPGEGHLTPVIVPGKLHGQRSLVGYSYGVTKDSDMTEQLNKSYSQSVPDIQCALVLPRCRDCLKTISIISITFDKGRHQAAERCYTEQESQLLDKLGDEAKIWDFLST